MTFIARVAFRTAVRLFPGWFRDRYGSDMVHDFDRRLAQIRSQRGVLAAVRFVSRALIEVTPSAVAVRFGRAEPRGRWSVNPLYDDCALALKSLTRSPGWTGTALLILTLGIGGTTAVFSVLNAVLLRPLPYAEGDRLVALWTVNEVQDIPDGSSWENARDWVERSRSLEAVTLMFRPEFTTSTVTSFGEPERIHVGWVGPNFFELLGVQATLGRVFSEADLNIDQRLAVVEEALWHSRFGSDPGVIEESLTIDGEEYRVVGVVPDDVGLPVEETQIWRLMDVRTPAEANRRGWDAYIGIGRIAPGVTPALAQRELDGVAAQLQLEYPETNRNRGVALKPLRAEIVGDRLPPLLWTLFGSMVLVLLIGGTNVAQLMLSRGIERRRELAVRASLGATRSRVNIQLILESVLLTALAGVGGLVLAWVGLRGLVSMIPASVPLTHEVRIDASVLLLAFIVSSVLAPAVGMLPALAGSRMRATDVLRGTGRAVTGRDRRLRSILVVAEVAMAVVLLAGAGLLLRSAIALQDVNPGFEAERTLVARVDLSARGEEADGTALHERLQAEVERIPGVEGVGAIGAFFVERFPDQTITIVGDPPREAGEPTPRLTTDLVVPGFFDAIRVQLQRGRPLDFTDVGGSGGSGASGARPNRVLVNDAWVRTFAADRDPVGLQFRWGTRVEGDPITVVGVVGDLSRTSLEEATYPQMFLAGAPTSFDLMVRTTGDPLDVAQDIRSTVRRLDPQAAVSRVSSAADRYDAGLAPRHFQTVLFGVFAGLATLLAAIGLFAILHDAVEARRREIGIRLALGAAPSGVRALVLRQGLGLAAAGLALGLVASLAFSSVMASLVFGIEPSDPATLAAVSILLLVVSTVASAAPAFSATRVPPAETLTADG